MKTTSFVLIFVLLTLFVFNVDAQKKEGDEIWDEWYTENNKSLIKIFRATNGSYYGKIIWLKNPTENGKPKVDEDNPDASKRKEPLVGLMILKKFKYDGNNSWSGGSIYDPENGKTYKCSIELEGDNLHVRGYVGIPALGRTTIWTRKK